MGRLIPHVQTDRAKEEEIRKTAERLRNQLDTDRSGQRAKQTLEFMDLAPLCDHWQWAKLGPLSRIYKADCPRCFFEIPRPFVLLRYVFGSDSDGSVWSSSDVVHPWTNAFSGTISFNEYCFRFGRRYQIEHNRRRRNRISFALLD